MNYGGEAKALKFWLITFSIVAVFAVGVVAGWHAYPQPACHTGLGHCLAWFARGSG